MNAPLRETPSPSRRRLLLCALGLGAAGAAGTLGWALARPYLVNPCLADLPAGLADHPLIAAAWEGIEPARLWDCHVHLAGIGDSGSGIAISERMRSPFNPIEYVQRLFYLNAGCTHDAPGQVDESYVTRLQDLAAGLAGAKLMLFAFDHVHDARGMVQPAQSAFYVPNDYAQRIAAAHPALFEWVCSIHPYRADCVEALEAAVAGGALAVKWLPPTMAIDPASPLCDRFYAALARLDLPLISHGGEERAVHGPGLAGWANPLRLRRALDAGVRVVVAHCAIAGEDVDLDRGGDAHRVPSFYLFARLMDSPDYRRALFADISSITFRTHDAALVGEILAREAWHERLLFGSDYPLPGVVPLISPAKFAEAGMLAADAVPVLERVREHNPILFDFVLKRHLHTDGRRFAASVFHTRDFFKRFTSFSEALS